MNCQNRTFSAFFIARSIVTNLIFNSLFRELSVLVFWHVLFIQSQAVKIGMFLF